MYRTGCVWYKVIIYASVIFLCYMLLCYCWYFQPLLDIVIYLCKLTTGVGVQVSLLITHSYSVVCCDWLRSWQNVLMCIQGPLSLLSYLVLSGSLLTMLRRPVGRMTVTEQKYEGEFRYINSRLSTNRYTQKYWMINCVLQN